MCVFTIWKATGVCVGVGEGRTKRLCAGTRARERERERLRK